MSKKDLFLYFGLLLEVIDVFVCKCLFSFVMIWKICKGLDILVDILFVGVDDEEFDLFDEFCYDYVKFFW